MTRGTGIVALLLLTRQSSLGVADDRAIRTPRWPRFVIAGLHRNLTLLAVAFVAVHIVTTVADGYAPIGLIDAFVPFVVAVPAALARTRALSRSICCSPSSSRA